MEQVLGKSHYLTNDEYHANPAISASGIIRLIKGTPAHYKDYLLNKQEQTEAMRFGTAAHMAVLEVDKFKTTYIQKPEGMNFSTKEGKEWKAQQTKEILSTEQYDCLRGIYSSIQRSPKIRTMLSNGEPEQSYFWKDPATGLICKCRPDFLGEHGVIDFKTTESASPTNFQSSVFKYCYNIQAAFYIRGLKASLGFDFDLTWLAAEKSSPYAVAVYRPDQESLAMAEAQIDFALNAIKECQETDIWPGYEEEVREISPIYFGL